MANKEVRTVLNPTKGKFKKLSATVDDVVAAQTKGTKAEGSVRAAHTNVVIEAEGDPGATFDCLVEAIYDNGDTLTIVDEPVSLDWSGTYMMTHTIGLQTTLS